VLDHYRTVNSDGWDALARAGCDSSVPYGELQFAEARAWLDEHGWLPWNAFDTVLCLAAGGGQQGPLFARLGYDVTVLDLSAEQLRLDEDTARRNGLSLRCVRGDMLDLSVLEGRRFDLVYQPVSSLYVPDVRRCYREVARVLAPGGLYYSEHWNPVQMQLSTRLPWDGSAYRVESPLGVGGLDWVAEDGSARCRHFVHSITDLVGGLCDAGLAIIRFGDRPAPDEAAEAGSQGHLATYLPTFFSILARSSRPAWP
jgi:SAM-dependent methyltransferase